jgi:hypothetical protein
VRLRCILQVELTGIARLSEEAMASTFPSPRNSLRAGAPRSRKTPTFRGNRIWVKKRPAFDGTSG